MLSLFNASTTAVPIYRLLNTDDEEEKDLLTQRWKDSKLSELNFVGVVGGLLANVLTSTNSWPNVLQDGHSTPWTVRACWFSGLMFALASILTAASQSIRLYRLSCRMDANARIRDLLSSTKRGKNGEVLPRQSHVFHWHVAVIYLICSVLIMVAGLFVLVWSAVREENWWKGQAQLAITFTVVACIVIGMVFWEQVTLFSSDESSEREDRSVRL